MTERMGYWVDLDDAYWTMDPAYVESVWWSLKQIFDKGLLVEDHRVAPYCPRCGTGLSDHEVAQGYETVVDPSVYVRFPVTAGPAAEHGADLLVWTTTPWTLVSNTAVAVNPRRRRTWWRAARRARSWSPSRCWPRRSATTGSRCWHRFPGTALERSGYQRPFDLVEIPGAHYVILADYVTTEDGTGLVHQAPAFGADDLAATRAYGLPVVNPVEPDGHFRAGVPLVGGLFFKDADTPLVADLRERGLLFREQPYEHATRTAGAATPPLLYYALPSWYIRTTAIKDQLLAGEREDQLVPGDDQARPVRRLAEQQRRLGAVAQPLLGHAAAGVALSGRPRHLRRLPGRAGLPGRPRPGRPRPAPAVRRRGHVHLPASAGPRPTGCRR